MPEVKFEVIAQMVNYSERNILDYLEKLGELIEHYKKRRGSSEA